MDIGAALSMSSDDPLGLASTSPPPSAILSPQTSPLNSPLSSSPTNNGGASMTGQQRGVVNISSLPAAALDAVTASPISLGVPPSPVVLSPTSIDPLPLISGYLLKKNDGLLGNQSKKMFFRLMLGVSYSQPSVLIAFDSDQPNATKLKTHTLDASLSIRVEAKLLQISLRTKGQVANLTTAASLQSLVGMSLVLQCPTAREYHSWLEALEQVRTQALRFDEAYRAEKAAAEEAAALKKKQAALAKKQGSLPPPSPSPPPASASALPTALPVGSPNNTLTVPSPASSTTSASSLTSPPNTATIAQSFNPESVVPIAAVSPVCTPSSSPALPATLPPIPIPSPALTPLGETALSSGGSRLSTTSRPDELALSEDADADAEKSIPSPVDAALMPSTPSDHGSPDLNSTGSSGSSAAPFSLNAATPSLMPVLSPEQEPEEDPAPPLSPAAIRRNMSEGEQKNQTESDTSHVLSLVLSETTVPDLKSSESLELGDEDVGVSEPESLSSTNTTSGTFSNEILSTTASSTTNAASMADAKPTLDFSYAGGSTNDFTGIGHDTVRPASPSSAASASQDLNTPSSPPPLRTSGSVDSLPTPTSATNAASTAAITTSTVSEAKKKEILAQQKAAEKKQADAKAMRVMKTRMYQKLFNLPPTEQLIEDYSCAIKKAILLHGRLYLSWNYLCFFSSIFSHKTVLVVPVGEILQASAASVALLFDNSIKIFVQTGPLPIPKINAQGQIIPLPGAPPVIEKSTSSSADKDKKDATAASTAAALAQSALSLGSVVPVATAAVVAAAAAVAAVTGGGSASNSVPNSVPGSESNSAAQSPLMGSASDSALTPGISPALLPQQSKPDAVIDALEIKQATLAETQTTAVAPTSSTDTASSADSNGVTASTPASIIISQPVSAASSTIAPAIIENETYADPVATTSNASIELTSQQVQYLISINHPNIITHFFASFLMRDHCLALIEGLLRKRREANPEYVAMQLKYQQSEELRQRNLAASIAAASNSARMLSETTAFLTPPTSPLDSKEATAAVAEQTAINAAAAAAEKLEKEREREAKEREKREKEQKAKEEALLRSASSSAPSSPSAQPASDAGLVSPIAVLSEAALTSLVSPEPGVSSSLTVTDPPHPRKDQRKKGGELKKKKKKKKTPAVSSSGTSVADNLPKFHLHPRIDFGDLTPPADDFSNAQWDDIVDDNIQGVNSREFFALFLSDTALWSTKDYAMNSGKGDQDWELSNWFEQSSNIPVSQHKSIQEVSAHHGPLVRDSRYQKLLTGSPLGPNSTRVHQQSTYTATDTSAKVETRNVTPDVPFADCMHVLERITLDDVSGHSCRIRVQVFVRFTKQPWKMKMFISLIKTKTRDDVQSWYRDWIASIQKYISKHQPMVEAAIARAEGKSVEVIHAEEKAEEGEEEGEEEDEENEEEEEEEEVGNEVSTLHEERTSSPSVEVSQHEEAKSISSEAESREEVEEAFDAELDTSFSAAPPKPQLEPLVEWAWLRGGLSMIPIFSPSHIDTVMGISMTVRESVREYRRSELIFACFMVWASFAFAAQQSAEYGILFWLLPWRLLAALLNTSPALLLAAGALSLAWQQLKSQRDVQMMIARLVTSQQLLAQNQKRVQKQVQHVERLLQDIKSSQVKAERQQQQQKKGPMQVNEHHF